MIITLSVLSLMSAFSFLIFIIIATRYVTFNKFSLSIINKESTGTNGFCH